MPHVKHFNPKLKYLNAFSKTCVSSTRFDLKPALHHGGKFFVISKKKKKSFPSTYRGEDKEILKLDVNCGTKLHTSDLEILDLQTVVKAP